LVILSYFQLQQSNFFLSAFLLLLASLLGTFYYLRIIRLIAFDLFSSFALFNNVSYSSLIAVFLFNLPNMLFLIFLNPLFAFSLFLSSNLLILT